MTPQDMAAALEEGSTYRDLGDDLGVSRDAARMRAKRAGLRSRHLGRPGNPNTPRRVQVARQMLAEGCELEAVRERLGMRSTDAVRMMLWRARA